MNMTKHIQTWILITLLALFANGVVSAKLASGHQNLSGNLHQSQTVLKALLHQGLEEVSTMNVSGSPLATKGGDTKIFRQGTSKESPTRLNRKAQEAENSDIGIHGVSGSTTKTPGCSSASCSDLEAAGFKVHKTPTRRDKNHVTIELPKPITKSDAIDFNNVLGR